MPELKWLSYSINEYTTDGRASPVDATITFGNRFNQPSEYESNEISEMIDDLQTVLDELAAKHSQPRS